MQMASNPPFQLEDQTDEDFFDKLVNDDDDDVDFKATASSAVAALVPSFSDGNESDEARAFANLSIGEVNDNENNSNKTGLDDSGSNKGFEVNGKVGEVVGDEIKAVAPVSGNVKQFSGALVSGDVFRLNSMNDSNNGNNTSKPSSDCTVISKSGGSVGSGVKEVGWSAFTADSVLEDSNRFGSYSDFFTELGENARDVVGNVGGSLNIGSKVVSGNEVHDSANLGNSNNYPQYQEGHGYGSAVDEVMAGQDLNSSQYWENLYPGWKYDPTSGQWYQVDGFGAATNAQGSMESNSAADWSTSDGKSGLSYLQKTAQSSAGTVAENGTTESVTNWNQLSQVNEATEIVSSWNQVSQGTDSTGVASDWNHVYQVNNGYPSHMVFDPQYPDWYYDTVAQEWRSLDSYNGSVQSEVQAQDHLNQNGHALTETYTHNNDQKTYGMHGQVNNHTTSQGFSSHRQDYNWARTFTNYSEQVSNNWQPGNIVMNQSGPQYSGNQQENYQGQKFSESDHVNQQNLNEYGGTVSYYEKVNQGQNGFSATIRSQSFVSSGNFSQDFSQSVPEQIEQKHLSTKNYDNQNLASFSQQPLQPANQYSFAPTPGRSSAGRPPHALVAFGFGGKVIVMKDSSSSGISSFGNQSSVGCNVSVLNLAEVVTEKADAPNLQPGVFNYFRALCEQSFPGPLTGGNVGTKELNKWIDERVASSETHDMDFQRGKVSKLLLSLLKIACQYYGKLRSPFGTDTVLKENDHPESAVARLFATAKTNATPFSQYGAVTHCLQSLASEEQMRVTAAEIQHLLVSGRKKEALLCAQEGQLWGPALVLAAQLGNEFYVDTVKQMALRQLVAGSPLRTLCLLIAGQPADVFSTDSRVGNSMPGAMSTLQQTPQLFVANSMLDYWEENLAVIASNRTKDDELVLIHLGDSLWKERSDIIAAHICYLVAEANFEPYSDSARLCLIGADHLKFPRTYASPEAVQRTEIYEYSMVLGNSQFILATFQPYKLVYAHMLAEVGRMSDALKYCQALQKSLKTGRSPEVESLRQLVSSLEERIKSHQQGGFSTNLAPAKLVGKLLNLFDSTAHRVVGSLPPPVPSTSGGSAHGTEHFQQSMGPRVSTSQSTMAMSSLMPSAYMEPVSESAADGSRMTKHTRSVSEPDFGRSPGQVESSKDTGSTSGQGKAASRFGRFGFGSQLFQKTVGLVLRPRQDRQAKLGETNKFYYDEKLKRWIEEGAEPPAEEAALPPPPTAATFQNGTSDYNLKTALKSEGSRSSGSPEFKSPTPIEHSSGIPPLPPSSNQFSARGRMGFRSRYVDTFNQGGGNPTNLFPSPSFPSVKPAGGANPKFFVPSPTPAAEQPVDNTVDSARGSSATEESPVSTTNDSAQPPPTLSSIPMQKFASMDNISHMGAAVGNGPSAYSRRTASWSGSIDEAFSPPNNRNDLKPLGEVLGMPPSTFMPMDSSTRSSANGGSFGDDLHEVEL